MEVILLEKITKLGDPGDLVNIKSGYARNYLIPTGKAIQANAENKAEYEKSKVSLEKAEEKRVKEAKNLAKKLESVKLKIPVPVSEEETLYGSIGTREIVESLALQEIQIDKSSVRLPQGTFKELGNFNVDIELHPEVIQSIEISIVAEK